MGKFNIILVLSLIFVLFFFGYAVKSNLYSAETETVETYRYNQARNIAESVAMVAVRQILEGNDQFIPESNNTKNMSDDWNDINGKYELELENQGDSLLVVNSTGIDPSDSSVKYTVTATMNKKGGNTYNWPLFPYALYSKGTISMSGSMTIEGNIATSSVGNQSVDLNGYPRIIGSLFIGPNGDIEKTVKIPWGNYDTFISNGVSNMDAIPTYELPKFPEYPSKNNTQQSIKLDWQSNGKTLAPEMYDGSYISSIEIPSNYTLNIDTGNKDRTLFVGDLLVKQGQINVIGNGKLKIIIEDNFELNGSSKINPNGNQNKVFTYYGGDKQLNFRGNTEYNGNLYAKEADIHINGSNGIQGHIISGGKEIQVNGDATALTRTLLAPNADIKFSGSGKLTGAIVGNRFEGSGGAKITYSDDFDSELPELEGGGAGGFALQSWY